MSKKGSFHWSEQSKKSFENLKQALLTPLLKMPNFGEEFIVECDASGTGIGDVLTQLGHPIAFFSQGLKGKISFLFCL